MYDVCLTSVTYIGPKSRTERPRKTEVSIEVAHVTCDSDTIFKVQRSKVKGQGHQAALFSAALKHEAGAAVTMKTYWAWETTATLRLLGGAGGTWVLTGEERGGAYHVATCRAC